MQIGKQQVIVCMSAGMCVSARVYKGEYLCMGGDWVILSA